MLLMSNPNFADFVLATVICLGVVVMIFDLGQSKRSKKAL